MPGARFSLCRYHPNGGDRVRARCTVATIGKPCPRTSRRSKECACMARWIPLKIKAFDYRT